MDGCVEDFCGMWLFLFFFYRFLFVVFGNIRIFFKDIVLFGYIIFVGVRIDYNMV